MSLSHILVCLVPTPGHMNPLLAVAQHLSSVGHNVTILTADVFRDKVIAAGLDFVSLTGIANYDYRRLEDFFPDKRNLRGMDLTIHYFKHAFGNTIPDHDQMYPPDHGRKTDRSDSRGCTVFGGFSPVAGSQEQPAPNRWLRSRSSANDKCRFWTALAARYDTGRITPKRGREPLVRGCFPTSH
jgi:hypothetical protein